MRSSARRSRLYGQAPPRRAVGLSALMCLSLAVLAAPACATGRLEVDASKVLRAADRRMLLGTNVAGWFAREDYEHPQIQQWHRALAPTLIRLPGGSWADITWWNGNGVVKEDGTLDMSKYSPEPYSEWSAPWGTFDVDYSDYAPSFLAFQGRPSYGGDDGQWHGNVDVKFMHDFIQGVGCEALVIVNGGQGSPRDAAEWVRWANQKMGYNVRYWEIGNELGGSWEAGHALPGGKTLNGHIFARRYEEFARAIKAVDPTAKVGCMDWIGDVLAHCGELVDFVSIHTYPANGSETDEELFAKALIVERDMARMRALIEKYQPERADEIEIGYSEWNMGWPDMRGAQWHAIFAGEMLKHGMAFANQFHIFNMTPVRGSDATRMSHYWGYWLWSKCMGDALVASDLTGADHVSAYATLTDDGLSIMAVNRSKDEPAELNVSVKGFEPGPEGEELRFTRREYLWVAGTEGPVGRRSPAVFWNTGPSVQPIKTGTSFCVSAPPSSIIVCRIPAAGRALTDVLDRRPETTLIEERRLQIIMPGEGYANTPVEVWVCAFNGESSDPYLLALPDADITVAGPASADRETVRLAEAAGYFILNPSGAGEAIVGVTLGESVATKTINFKPSIPRRYVFWEFDEETVPPYLRSQWTLSMDPSIRPNEGVARVNIGGDNPGESKKQEALVIQELPGPDRLVKSNIRGAFFDLKVSDDFRCDDEGARVQLIMQSSMNWWMSLGSVRLADVKDWETHTFVTENPDFIKAMPGALNVWVVLYADAPVEGSIFIDGVGLMVR